MESDTDEAFVEAGEDFYHAEPPPMRAAPPVPTMMDYLLHYLSNPWVVLILAFVVYRFVYRPFWPRVAELWAAWNQRRREDRDAAEIVRNGHVFLLDARKRLGYIAIETVNLTGSSQFFVPQIDSLQKSRPIGTKKRVQVNSC